MSSILIHNKNGKELDDYKEDGFYPTPWEATQAALMAEKEWLDAYDRVDEPACGDGAMSEIIKAHGKQVQATDLVYRGYGKGEVDFLNINFPKSARCLFTNPPFSDDDGNPLAESFIRHAHYLEYEYIGMILKANFFNTKNRIALFHQHRPVRIRPYSWRIDFTGKGNNHFDCIFVTWMKGRGNGFCEFGDPLERPLTRHQLPLF